MCPCVSSSKYSYKNNTLPSRIGNNVRWNSPFNISATAPNNTHSRVALQPQIRRLPMTVGDGWRCTGSSYVYSPKPTAMGRKKKRLLSVSPLQRGNGSSWPYNCSSDAMIPDFTIGLVVWQVTGDSHMKGIKHRFWSKSWFARTSAGQSRQDKRLLC